MFLQTIEYRKEPNWSEYINLYYIYLNEIFPDTFNNPIIFLEDYPKLLKKRIKEGGRGLFLAYEKNEIIGLANIYLKRTELHIAEFYIIPKYRRKGYGKKFLENLKEWGKKRKAKQLVIEVNQDLKISNRFWKSFNFEKSKFNKRNIYMTSI